MILKNLIMDKKLHNFFNSHLLERYLVGDTSLAETIEVENYIAKYPEVAEAYSKLQDNLEVLAKADAVEAPKTILNNVLESIETSNKPKVITMAPKQRTPWYSIAASVAAVAFAVFSYTLYEKNEDLKSENDVVVEEIFDLRGDIEKNNSKLNQLSEELLKLNNPDSKKYVLSGNERAKDLKTVAYINPIDKTSMIDVITLPKLPEEQYYQMWAEFQDRMVNLGVLDESDRKLRQIPYIEDALALSITIENKKGKPEDSKNDKEVAEISLKEKEQ